MTECVSPEMPSTLPYELSRVVVEAERMNPPRREVYGVNGILSDYSPVCTNGRGCGAKLSTSNCAYADRSAGDLAISAPRTQALHTVTSAQPCVTFLSSPQFSPVAPN